MAVQLLMSLMIIAVIVLVAFIAGAAGQLTAQRTGKLLLFGGLVLLPLAVTGGGVAVGMRQSSQTEFCLSCHEMEPYGKSLFVDSPESLVAAHYQQRLITRDSTCYACHTDYALFGDAKAKFNGLRHVWVHYFGTTPEKLQTYQPYPNYNCLHCHDDARGYLEVASHQEIREELQRGTRSCLTCHDVAHDLEKARTGPYWVAP